MQNPVEALARARASYGAGDLAAAARLCASILDSYPRQLGAIRLLAIIMARSGRLAQALELFEYIVAIRPNDAGAQNDHANVLMQLGRYEEALHGYGCALELDPSQAQIHQNRGLTLQRLGRFGEGLQCHDRALQLQADYVDAQCERGTALFELGRYEEALSSYEQALRLKPDCVKAIFGSGNALRCLERLEEAAGRYARTAQLQPDHIAAHFNCGGTLASLSRHEAALNSFDRALALDPHSADIQFRRSIALHNLSRYEEAVASLDRTLALQPAWAEAHFNRGVALQRLRRPAEALASFESAVALDPKMADAQYNRGGALMELGSYAEALRSFDRTLELRPEDVSAHINRGVCLLALEQPQEALLSYERALQRDPDSVAAYGNRGTAYDVLGRVQEALQDYEHALRLAANAGETLDMAWVYENRATARLLTGDYVNGWQDFEWRRRSRPGMVDPRYPKEKLWLGRESLTGKIVLLHSEQGLGDTLQFCRYIQKVADLGATVILQLQAPLARLLGRLPGVSRLIVRGDSLPPFDYHCPLLSLPLAFGTTLETIPAQVPYIGGDPEKVRDWGARLGSAIKLRVGIVWSGGYRPNQPESWAVNNRRNLPLAKLAPLRNSAICFYSLQMGQPAQSELAELEAAGWDGPDLIDFTRLIEDFSDTAALVENLDLVISVDTSTAHLAGAMAKPVWILNRFDTCWRWLQTRTDSPWYPTARLYRQARAADWDSVVERVREDLFALAERVVSTKAG